MTNVRSFDVKAYDNALAGYADLGWGDDLRVTDVNATPLLLGNVQRSWGNATLPQYPVTFPNILPGQIFDLIGQTFAHEGRMPPLVNDNRLDAQYPNLTYVNSDDLRESVRHDHRGVTTLQLHQLLEQYRRQHQRDRPAAPGLGHVVDRIQPGAGERGVFQSHNNPSTIRTRAVRRPA